MSFLDSFVPVPGLQMTLFSQIHDYCQTGVIYRERILPYVCWHGCREVLSPEASKLVFCKVQPNKYAEGKTALANNDTVTYFVIETMS